MNSDMLLNRIRMAQQGLIGVHKKLYTLEHLLPSPDPAQFAETAKSAALLSERSTASLRGFLFTTTGGMPEGYYQQAAAAQGIKVSATDDYVFIRVPALLPKKKAAEGFKFLVVPLQAAFEEYRRQHALPHFSDCVICIEHIYDRCLPITAVRDYDNLEFKSILDVIALYCMKDDTGALCDLYHADANCPGGRLPVPVHVLGEELTACGTISELSRRISVIRSRNISMSCVFQNLAGLQNRYPQNQWQEILGNCDVQLFLGCTDQLTAEYVSQRTGIASVMVSSTSKALNTLRVSDYTPQYRESNGIGKRPLLTPDEVLRLPVDEALVILRGHKVLKVHKMDYSLHPAYKHLRECKASAHIPEWQTAVPETPSAIMPSAALIAKTPPKRRGRKPKTVVAADKTSIMTKPENEKELSHGNEQ